MKNNPLKQLGALGQSIWLDYIRRDLVAGDGLRRLIEDDGVHGMTSNPAIFEKAIAESHDYDEDIRAMALEGKGAEAIYETLSQRDVQSAADEFRPLYDRTGRGGSGTRPDRPRPPRQWREPGSGALRQIRGHEHDFHPDSRRADEHPLRRSRSRTGLVSGAHLTNGREAIQRDGHFPVRAARRVGDQLRHA